MDSSRVYCSLDELKAAVGLPSTVETYDPQLEMSIEAVARLVDDFCGRRFWSATETRVYTACDATLLRVEDLLSVTTLRVDSTGNASYGTTMSATCYYTAPVNATLGVIGYAQPYYEVRIADNSSAVFPVEVPRGVQITGAWGYATAVPAQIRNACIQQAAIDWKAVAGPYQGGREFQTEINYQGGGLHPFVRQVLLPFKLRTVA